MNIATFLLTEVSNCIINISSLGLVQESKSQVSAASVAENDISESRRGFNQVIRENHEGKRPQKQQQLSTAATATRSNKSFVFGVARQLLSTFAATTPTPAPPSAATTFDVTDGFSPSAAATSASAPPSLKSTVRLTRDLAAG